MCFRRRLLAITRLVRDDETIAREPRMDNRTSGVRRAVLKCRSEPGAA